MEEFLDQLEEYITTRGRYPSYTPPNLVEAKAALAFAIALRTSVQQLIEAMQQR